jgi:hypothetical protein
MLLNNDFILHVIRDVFGTFKSPILYGYDPDLYAQFWSPQHSMGVHMYYSHDINSPMEKSVFWDIQNESLNPLSFDYSDFFVSINYNLNIPFHLSESFAGHVRHFLKTGSKCLIVNPGSWADYFDQIMTRCYDIEREVKRFSMFKNQKVFVYENI